MKNLFALLTILVLTEAEVAGQENILELRAIPQKFVNADALEQKLDELAAAGPIELDLSDTGFTNHHIPDNYAKLKGLTSGKSTLIEWSKNGNIIVGFIDGVVTRDKNLIENFPLDIGIDEITEIGVFDSQHDRGLSTENYDILIDFENQRTVWNIKKGGFNPLGLLPLSEFQKGRFASGSLYVNYWQKGSLGPLTNLGGAFATIAEAIVLATKLQKGVLNVLQKHGEKLKLDENKQKQLNKIPTIGLNVEDAFFDPIKEVVGLKGGIYIGGGKSFPSSPGILAETSFSIDPFGLNALGFGFDNVPIPIPFTEGTMYWVRGFGAVENIQYPPWQVHLEAAVSLGKDQLPILGYPLEQMGTLNVKPNGYAEAISNFMFLGFPQNETSVIFDPEQSKIKYSFEDFVIDPGFLVDGSIAVTKSGLSSDTTAYVGIPKHVPIIGGYEAAGQNFVIEGKDNWRNWDVHSTISYTITPYVPSLCVTLRHPVAYPKIETSWNDCCKRIKFIGCVGCLETSTTIETKLLEKEVCNPEVAEVSGEFRVGLKVTDGGIDFYHEQKKPFAPYGGLHDRFSELYTLPTRKWETPFHCYTEDEKGRIYYYNYNWDKVCHQYFPVSKFRPAQQIVEGGGGFSFEIIDAKPVATIVRLHYEKNLNSADNISLSLPSGNILIGTEDNRPHGYGDLVNAISCNHNVENRELVFFIHRAQPGVYEMQVTNPEVLGEFSVEVFQQDFKPRVMDSSVAFVESAGNDSTFLWAELEVLDYDTPPSEINVSLFADSNKEGNDGLLLTAVTLEQLNVLGGLFIDLAEYDVNSGDYYLYAKIDDGINAAFTQYFDEVIPVNLSNFPPAVTNFHIRAFDGGFEIDVNPVSEDDDFVYNVVVAKESDPDHTGATFTLYSDPYRGQVTTLNNGEPYLVSVDTIDAEGRVSHSKLRRRVVPGLSGKRPLHIYSEHIPSATVNYPYAYQIHHLDGDMLENNWEAYRSHSEVRYSLLGDSKGAEINDSGMFTWTPGSSQIGRNHFVVAITPKMTQSGGIVSLEPKQVLHEFEIFVTPSINLSGISAHTHRFLSNPPRHVSSGNNYSYIPLTTLPDGNDYTIRLVEAPDGMVYNSEANSIDWETNDQSLGAFVELQLLNKNGDSIDSQRWFVDVKSRDSLLNDQLIIHSVELKRNDSTGYDEILFTWDAPVGDYLVEFSDSLNGEWVSAEDDYLAGGFGNVSGFKIPSSLPQTFFRISGVDSGQN